jgi:hypothetical protein
MFGDQEKRVFIKMMRQWAEFSGLGVITYCLMDNHFHVMMWVPGRMEMDHTGLLQELEGVWPEGKVQAWESYYQKQDLPTREEMDQAVLDRMGNLPEYMRVLKQSFTRWYNQKEGRKGTLWESRYRSVVVEDSPLALMSVAAYIDLNPFRAGLVEDLMDYDWNGYGAAMGGDKMARKGLDSLVRLSRGHSPNAMRNVRSKQLSTETGTWKEIAPAMAAEQKRRAAPKNWNEVQAAYRIWLVTKGESKKEQLIAKKKVRDRRGMDPVQVIEEYEKQGLIPLSTRLHLRVRSFSRGVALGGPEFLETLMGEYRSCFGPKRKMAGRRVRALGSLVMSLRQVD